jgi:hypothetical protein
MEEARRSTAAQKLPGKLLSQAVSKALQLSRAFPSLSPKELLVGWGPPTMSLPRGAQT